MVENEKHDQETGSPVETNVNKSVFRYNSPFVQVGLIGLVCFCCPGMFNALSGMGGGGQLDHTAANNANTALYTTFAIFGILGGGTYISMFWSIFNMGGVIGGLIPFIMNYNRETASSVNDGTYIGFMVFMTIGTVLALSILHPSKVIRNDGSKCTDIKYSNVVTESVAIAKLFTDWKMLLIVPAAWASNFFYSYQFNNVNGALFTLRTRGLNNVFYWGAQMIGSVMIGYIMDFSFKSRKKRGLAGIAVVAVLGTDAMFQSMVYWVIGGLADDSVILSRYVGFYKGVQSAGGAVAWQIDTHHVPYMNQLIVNWVLTTISYPLLALLVIKAVKDDDDKVAEQELPSEFPKVIESNDGFSKPN
ncbi:UNC93-like protein 1 [Artemisia annua]|uniref:UNC93-like protein 1 n=1 Tax=Artemisia annua TaxID=35608 RepID=A0A2U1LCS2_ARTAN|nr:UNC93-like protein 1 [Artemisia annua]